jgi:guanylate kinase
MAARTVTVSRRPFIVVVSGPSGVGKTTVVERVLERRTGIRRSVSMTTRAPRGGERDGVDYLFVSEEEFIRAREAGELLEWAQVHERWYGTPVARVEESLAAGSIVVLEIDVQGGMIVREKRPGAVLIFLLPPSLDHLERRLRGRGTDDEEVVRRRLATAEWELAFFDRYDYLVMNDEVERAAEEVVRIVDAAWAQRLHSRVSIAGRKGG